MLRHKVIKVADYKELEKQLNKASEDGFMPTCNPIELIEGGFLIMVAKQELTEEQKVQMKAQEEAKKKQIAEYQKGMKALKPN